MPGLPDCRTLETTELVAAAHALRDDGWRLITASTVPRPDGWTVLYHFERDQRLQHLRLEVRHGASVPAIDEAFPAAYLVENEMHELQGLPVTGMSIDYRGRLYRDFDGAEGWTHVHAPGEGERMAPACSIVEAGR